MAQCIIEFKKWFRLWNGLLPRFKEEGLNYAVLYANEKLVFNIFNADDGLYDPAKIKLFT